jgi:hypothetical protein
VNRHAASSTLDRVAALRGTGRRRLATVAAPLFAFGLVNLGGVPACLLLGRFHLALYAVPAFALAVWLSGRALERRARREGVQLSIRPWALTAAALCAGGMSTSRLGAAADVDVVATVGPFLAQAVGMWLLGRWAESETLIAAALLMVASSGVIGSLAAGDLAVALQFAVYGALLMTAGAWIKLLESTA